MTMNWPGSSGGDDAYDYDQPRGYDDHGREQAYGGYGGSGQRGAQGERRGGAFDEFRRQMEEMLGGTRPAGPTVLTDRGRGGGAAAPGPEMHVSDTGLALAAAASYWALPFLVRGRRKGRRMRRRHRQ